MKPTKQNKFGHPQAYDDEGFGVCDTCNRLYVNCGGGSSCEVCRAEELIECEKDYDHG